ncbi:MAG: 3-oxoacid CoA-transferase subunit A [Methyloligellaceae bacterium]
MNKRIASVEEAIAGITDGSTLMISGFGESGRPNMLIAAVLDSGVRDLTLISNNAGDGLEGLAALFLAERVSKLACSFPRGAMAEDVGRLVNSGKLELDVMPQGTLAERIRAAGAGVGAFFTPTGYGTEIAKGKETRIIDGVGQVLEYALHADFALVKALQGDRWGNVTYNQLARNFSPLMCMAAKRTIVEVDEFVELGEIDPANVITPGIFVDAMVQTKAVPAQAWRFEAA